MTDTGLGQGAGVVLGLTEKCEVKAGSTVTFDNLFTSLPLLDELTELGIGALATLRQNHFHGAPVANKTTLAKKPRGSYDFATDGKNLVVSWLDNKVVTCATNCVTCNPVSTAQRWSKSAKKRVDVPMPKPFEDYNKQMGGADLLDQFVSIYRVRIRSKKWWCLLCMGGKRFNGKCMEPFSHCTEAKNWYVRGSKKGCHDNSSIFWKK